jgi:acylphosphatase
MVSKTVKVRIYGRVQGVFFRHHTKLVADDLGLTGWVRNCADGSVEAVCFGRTDALEQMIDWFQLGPDSAVVNKVDIDELVDQSGPHQNFTIRY